VELPSDAIRIQEVTPAPLALASQGSATVVAWVRVDARLVNDKGWRVTELRTGNHDWATIDSLSAALNQEKQERARGELELMVKALERFRKDRGFYNRFRQSRSRHGPSHSTLSGTGNSRRSVASTL